MNILDDYECEGQITMDQYLSDLDTRDSPERCALCKWHYPPKHPCMIYKKIPEDCSESYRKRGVGPSSIPEKTRKGTQTRPRVKQ